MAGNGGVRLFAKHLAPNDNSKNQVYLGGDFSALNILPHGNITTDEKEIAGSKRERTKASLNLYWLTGNGLAAAPEAKLILYPKYPEVRMSGFLKSSKGAPSEVMASRAVNRVLFLGVVPDGRIIAYAVNNDHPLARELAAISDPELIGVFIDLGPVDGDSASNRCSLLRTLCEIHNKGWINSKKLSKDGTVLPYQAVNGGGYTLEAELGVSPNSLAEPDYLGWEVKQFGVSDLIRNKAKSPITLMTPEPNGGIYKTDGVQIFLERFGYEDKNGRGNRLNFGGIYSIGSPPHRDTGLRLDIEGYDLRSKKISDFGGGIVLLGERDELAAKWSFTSLIDHWNRKHARTVYVPSIKLIDPISYQYGKDVTLCSETDFFLFLDALISKAVYLDPGIKLVFDKSGKPSVKRRNQFRVRQPSLTTLYRNHDIVDACGIRPS